MRKRESVLVNGIFFSVYRVLNILFPLVTSVYVARILLADGTGRVAYAQNIVTYFTLVAALGLPTYGTREIAKIINNRKEYNTTFLELFIINAISTTICAVCYYSLCFFIPAFKADIKLYLVAGISILLNYINIDWLYQGREEYRYISIRGFVVKLICTLLLFVIVKNKTDYVIYAGLHCLIIGGNSFVNILGLKKRISLDINKLHLMKHFKPLLILFATNIAIELYTMLDTTMLGIMCEKRIVGYYSYAMKTSKIIISVLSAATTVLLPRLSHLYSDGEKGKFNILGNKGILFLLLSSIPLATILCFNADYAVLFLYGSEYIPAISTLRILSMLIIPISFSTYLGIQILCSTGLEKKMLEAVSIGAALNIVLNSVLIPRFQQNGAAVASLISEVAVASIDFLFAYKVLKIHINRKHILTIFVSLLLMIACMCTIRFFVHQYVVSLIVSSGVGILIYMIVLYVFDVGEMKEIVSKFRMAIRRG